MTQQIDLTLFADMGAENAAAINNNKDANEKAVDLGKHSFEKMMRML